MMSRRTLSFALVLSAALALAIPATGQQSPAAGDDLVSRIDEVVQEVLADTGVPSASIAVVRKGQMTHIHAYGRARLDPQVPATPDMRYSVGAISKQFTAAAILLLQEQGTLVA